MTMNQLIMAKEIKDFNLATGVHQENKTVAISHSSQEGKDDLLQ